MKKIMWLCSVSVLFLTACTKHIDSYNTETKAPSAVPAATLFSNASVTLTDGLASASVNTNVFRFTVKHWAMSTYQDELQYNFTTRAIPDAWWTRMYRDILNDLNNATKVVNKLTDLDIAANVRANQLAVLDITEVLTYSILVNTFGDVPYSQALTGDSILFPTYDDAKTIYADLMARLNNDISGIDPAGDGFSANQDLFAGGDMAKWLKFANSLKMRLGMTLADVDEPTAKAAVEAADAGAISSADDNMLLTYLSAPPNSNPLYDDIVLGGRGDYLAAKDLMLPLTELNDPRKTHFFKPNNAGDYVGSTSGIGGSIANYSQPSDQVSEASAPYDVLDYSETEFYRAEAIERGFAVAGTAEEHYNNAIKASILYWGGTEAEADAYIAQPGVAYATAEGDWKQKIGFQKWIALYGRPYEGWTELRRLDYPKLTPPEGAISGFPNRLTYPAGEQQVNGGSYTAAASKIGGDEVETKLFWDVN
jgi:Starch-binding associating with outer membrane